MTSKQKQPPVSVFGQRSIPSSFFSRSSNSSEDSKAVVKNQSPKRDSCVSLSDFLNRKLNETPALHNPTKVQERSKPFTSIFGLKNAAKTMDDGPGDKTEKEEDKTGVCYKVVLEQFKQTGADNIDNKGPCSTTEEQSGRADDNQGSGKRKNPFEGFATKNRTKKPILVLGDHPTGRTCIRRRVESSSKKHRPAYNHYANGSGWWDCDMEGVDSEEVGLSEVWEGVGSTTYGGIIDWH